VEQTVDGWLQHTSKYDPKVGGSFFSCRGYLCVLSNLLPTLRQLLSNTLWCLNFKVMRFQNAPLIANKHANPSLLSGVGLDLVREFDFENSRTFFAYCRLNRFADIGLTVQFLKSSYVVKSRLSHPVLLHQYHCTSDPLPIYPHPTCCPVQRCAIPSFNLCWRSKQLLLKRVFGQVIGFCAFVS